MKNKNLLTLSFIALLFLVPISASAALVPCATSDNPAPCTLCHFIVGIWKLIDYGFKIIVFLALTGLVIAGIMYIVSAGSEELIKTAKTFIKNILYGLGFVLAAWLFIFVVMNYFGVKSDLGIGKADGWTKFTCSTESSAVINGGGGGGGSPIKYTCDKVDINNNGVIDVGEGACNADPNGTQTYEQCRNNCEVAPAQFCGNNNEGMCLEGLTCPSGLVPVQGTCGGNQRCCKLL